MKTSLLSHIASRFISEYENVANSSVAYLLNKYPAARETLRNILNLEQIPYNYKTELSTDSNGRPDITGLDTDGNKTIIIEWKFWANLTDNQPVNYLKELWEKGKLIFLAPDKRIISLNLEIKNRLWYVDDRVTAFSWNSFLNLVEQENNKNYNNSLSSDLTQLKELCSQMDSEWMPPLSMSDLDPMNGRRSYQFADLIDECNWILRKRDKAIFKWQKSTWSKDGYWFYFKTDKANCRLLFSSYERFTKDSHTPIWLYLWSTLDKKSDKISHIINSFDNTHSYDDKYHTAYGILLNVGMDKDQVVKHIVETVKSILTFLDENMVNDKG